MEDRVRANLLGGTGYDRQKILRALTHLYNSATVQGFAEVLAVFTDRGKWRIEIAHLHGSRVGTNTPRMPRGVPTDVRVQLMAELSGLGIPIEGVSLDN